MTGKGAIAFDYHNFKTSILIDKKDHVIIQKNVCKLLQKELFLYNRNFDHLMI